MFVYSLGPLHDTRFFVPLEYVPHLLHIRTAATSPQFIKDECKLVFSMPFGEYNGVDNLPTSKSDSRVLNAKAQGMGVEHMKGVHGEYDENPFMVLQFCTRQIEGCLLTPTAIPEGHIGSLEHDLDDSFATYDRRYHSRYIISMIEYTIHRTKHLSFPRGVGGGLPCCAFSYR